MSNGTPSGPVDERDMDHPRAVAALFADEAAAGRALIALHDAGFTSAWLGTTRAQMEDGGFSVVLREQGGSAMDQFVRHFSGNGGESVYNILTNHGVADDVARRLERSMPQHAAVVVAGSPGDVHDAARRLQAAGGVVQHAAGDGGDVGASTMRAPGDTPGPQE